MRLITKIKCEFAIGGAYFSWVSVFRGQLKGSDCLQMDDKMCIELANADNTFLIRKYIDNKL